MTHTSYNDCYKRVLADNGLTEAPEYPPVTMKWYGYKKGEAIIFDTEKAARDFTHNVETFFQNHPTHDDIHKLRIKLQREASEIFHSNLREEYSNVPDEVYDLCYNLAYDRYHSDGYDEVANAIPDIIAFSKKSWEAWVLATTNWRE